MIVFMLLLIAVGVLLISETGQQILGLIIVAIGWLIYIAIFLLLAGLALAVIAVVVGLLIWGISSLS